MSTASALLLLNVSATLYMTGLIWFVQVVHYPLFAHADRARFADFAARHQRWTTFVVAPPMLLELITAAALCVFRPKAPAPGLPEVGLALVIALWASTALLQVPQHRRLSTGYDQQAVERLVRSNWLRTLLWTGRSALVLTLWCNQPA